MQAILDKLGFSAKYKGYRMLTVAIDIAVHNDEAVTKITQMIYPEVAKICGTNSINVEKDIRKAIEMFWIEGDKTYYSRIAGYKITSKPTNAEFIAAVSCYIIRKKLHQR